MPETWIPTALEDEAAGRRALQDGKWREARAAFRRAVAEDETPEALEGLSWAAWWLDDADGVFAARKRAYRLYRARGEAGAAARMATWLAIDELDFRNAAAPANGWLRRAHRLLDGVEAGPAHGWLAFQDGYLAHQGGDTEAALERGRRAAGIGRRHRVPDLEMLGLALEGASLVACARVPEGMRCLDEAAAIALEGDAELPIAAAWTFCLLVSACLAVLDLDRAAGWCDRIAAFAERYGSRYMLAFCRAEYGVLHAWRGRWSDAEALLEAAVQDFKRSRPAWAPGPLAALADLRRRQRRPQDAVRLLDEAGGTLAASVCRAALALDAGDATQAAQLLERVLRRQPRERVLDRAPVLALLVSARVAQGRPDAATAPLAELRAAEEAAGTPAMRARADFAEGLLLAGRRDHERGRERLEDAVDGFDAVAAPYEAAQARLALAASATAAGEVEAAAAEAGAARAALRALGVVGRPLAPATASGASLPAGAACERAMAGLSPREREVLALLAEGLTNRQVAERLVVSEHTVHRHVSNLLRKLGVPSRAAAAALAVRAGKSPPASRNG